MHVREIVVGSNMDKIYIVMDYVEHDLKSLMENMKEPFLIGEVLNCFLLSVLKYKLINDIEYGSCIPAQSKNPLKLLNCR